MKLKEKRGASLVEFAIVVPLLMLFVFGIIEFSILLYDKAMLTNACREGARAGIVYHPSARPSQSDVEQIVRSYCINNLITFGADANVTVTTTPVDPTLIASGDTLTVDARYQYTFLVLPAFLTDFAGGLELKALSTMRAE